MCFFWGLFGTIAGVPDTGLCSEDGCGSLALPQNRLQEGSPGSSQSPLTPRHKGSRAHSRTTQRTASPRLPNAAVQGAPTRRKGHSGAGGGTLSQPNRLSHGTIPRLVRELWDQAQAFLTGPPGSGPPGLPESPLSWKAFKALEKGVVLSTTAQASFPGMQVRRDREEEDPTTPVSFWSKTKVRRISRYTEIHKGFYFLESVRASSGVNGRSRRWDVTWDGVSRPPGSAHPSGVALGRWLYQSVPHLCSHLCNEDNDCTYLRGLQGELNRLTHAV